MIEVERERSIAGTTSRSPRPRSSSEWRAQETDFRSDYESNYAAEGASFDDYAPAYRHGYESAQSEFYRGKSWDEVEPEVRREWEKNHPDREWTRYRGAAQRGWERTESDLPGSSPERIERS